jgi:hypothetical protein
MTRAAGICLPGPEVVQVAVGDGSVRGVAGREGGGKLGQLIEDLLAVFVNLEESCLRLLSRTCAGDPAACDFASR